MKAIIITVLVVMCFFLGCYDPEEDLTSIRAVGFNLVNSENPILADEFSNYAISIELPGLRFGASKSVVLNSTWGLWPNDSTSIGLPIAYNEITDSFTDTIVLKASRSLGPFSIQIRENSNILKTLNLNADPNFPDKFQVSSDSIKLTLMPGNTTQLKAFFFNEIGFPSDAIKFKFKTDANVNIFPDEVFINSSQSIATLQVSTETLLDTIKVYGEIPDMGQFQPEIDTLKIAIIKN